MLRVTGDCFTIAEPFLPSASPTTPFMNPTLFTSVADASRTRRLAAATGAGLLLAVLTACVCWPGIHGFWGRDDYAQLALVRMLDSPWALFVHDHYIEPGSVFRPLGFASMWLGASLFGSDYAAHAMADIGLHALVVLTLFGVLRAADVPRLAALVCTLLFALHPAVTGTVMWWSARFDLLSTLFILLALLAAQTWRRRSRWPSLVLAAAAMLAAMLSKEIGLVAVPAAILLWLHAAWREPGWRSRAWCGCIVAISCALVFLLWRWAVLGTLSSNLTGSLPMDEAIVRGLSVWLHQAPGYLSFWSRLGGVQRAGLLLAGVAVAASLVAARPGYRDGRALELTGMGLCLLLLPALLQAPVTAMNAIALHAGFSAVEAAMQSRLYYLGMAGVAMVLAAILMVAWRQPARLPRRVGLAAVFVAVLAFAVQSHSEARGFAQRSWSIATVARAASLAVSGLDLPPAPCHVALTGIEPPPEWGGFVSADSIIKALAPDLARVDHCWFHANYRTGFYLLRAPVTVADAAPYLPWRRDGRELAWRHIGDVVIALLGPTSDVDPHKAQLVLHYRRGRFVPEAPHN